MKREFKFRGKSLDGIWEYGDLLQWNNGYTFIGIHSEDWIEDCANSCDYTTLEKVDPNTVGQFTGLYDKNGKEIYEGDIIRTYGSKGDEIKHTVEYSDKEAMFCTKLIGAEMLGGSITQRWLDEFEFEVIGNVHDNPELLKGCMQ